MENSEIQNQHVFPTTRAKKWILSSILLAIVGAAISVYSIKLHLEVTALGESGAFCNINSTINCDAVVKSKFSEFLGQPLGVWGFLYFAALLALLGVAFSSRDENKAALATYSYLTVLGAVLAGILAGVSFFGVGALCLVCLGIYGVLLFQTVLFYIFRKEVPKDVTLAALSNNFAFAILIAVVLGGKFISKDLLSDLLGVPRQPKMVTNQDDLPKLQPTVQEIPIDRSPYSGFGEDYRKGPDNAQIVLVEFADFECPACSAMSEVLNEVYLRHKDQIQIVFKNYPLDQSCNKNLNRELHKHACQLAVMARCAGQFGKFWEFSNLAFGEQRSAPENAPIVWAGKMGLSASQIADCANNPGISDKIKNDLELGNKIGIQGTPTLFINGQRYSGGTNAGEISAEIIKLQMSGAPPTRSVTP